MSETKLTLLKDLRNKLPATYLGELAKVSSEKKATELARIFFTYQHLYDNDPDHKNKLGECSISSIMTCLLVCAKTGLWPDPVTNYIYFIPYGTRAKPEISYQGLVHLMSASDDVILIYADVVREGEKCNPDTLEHHRSFESLNNPIIGAYAACKFKNGEILKCVMGKDELNKVKAVAKTKRVWDAWFEEMCKKAVLRRLSKMVLPQLREVCTKLKAALAQENSDYDIGRTLDHDEAVNPDQLMEMLEKEGKENE